MAELQHHGTPHVGPIPHSGRYPWGSGEDPYQDPGVGSLYSRSIEMEKAGMKPKEIADALGMTLNEYRARRSTSMEQVKAARAAEAVKLRDKGWSQTAIAERMGVSEGTVRNYLKNSVEIRQSASSKTADVLRAAVSDLGYVDVGKGVEAHLGVNSTRLKTALQKLKDEGYGLINVQVDQLGTDHKTTIKVLCPPGKDDKENYKYLVKNLDKIHMYTGPYSDDNGKTWADLEYPASIDSKRIKIRYAEEGGTNMDGVIQLRRGVDDIALDKARYAQVRILVDGDRYLKGMAMYADDMPDGVDIVFNTNKHEGTPLRDVLKPVKTDKSGKIDEDNPFGTTIDRQYHYTDKDGKEHLSPINIVNEEGKWDEWSRTLSSQMLSKQSWSLAKKQLNQSLAEKEQEFKDIMELNNPEIKKRLLESFADDCDASAVHLKAAALPRQASKVILPIPDMNPGEIYAPGYRDGERVVLIRHPHGGIFEIPELVVNNKQKTANSLIHNAIDAVGIHPRVAEQLSGADFDGDTVIVIPNNEGKIKVSAPLKQLEGFDPKEVYAAYPGMPKVGKEDNFHKGDEMGKISNLITDMTIQNATQDEIARAVRHSMVVIDAEKHNLNWKLSYQDNQIAQLKEKYQGGSNRGAATLISRAKSTMVVDKLSQRFRIDPETGKKIYLPVKEKDLYYEKKVRDEDGNWVSTGKMVKRTSRVPKAAYYDDLFELSSGTRMETIYATYGNQMKALANKARLELEATPSLKYSPSAAKVYAPEVESLNAKLLIAIRNSPLERQAQILGNNVIKVKKAANPDMDKDDLKKLKGQALIAARNKVGAKKTPVDITPKEWEAIQAGAISSTKLKEILKNTDLDVIRKYATPKASTGLSSAQMSRVKALAKQGYTQAEIADQFGVSVTTINNIINN